MNVFIIIIIVGLVGGILFLTNDSGQSKQPREKYLEKLKNFLAGTIEPIADKKNAFRVLFDYYDRSFIYEDRIEEGFSDGVNKAYLKIKTNKSLDISFVVKEKEEGLHSKTLIFSTIDKQNIPSKETAINLPEKLEPFKIVTSDPMQAKALLENSAVGKIISYYKDSEAKGRHHMSIKVRKGVIILDFHPVLTRHPSLLSLYASVNKIQDHLEKLTVLAEAVDALQF